jgi:MFS family permease
VQYDLIVKGTALVGTLCGQVIFGLLGDRLGRKAPYGWTLMIMVGGGGWGGWGGRGGGGRRGWAAARA